MSYCKTALSPVLTHWRYCSLALCHRSILCAAESMQKIDFFKIRISICWTFGPVSCQIFVDLCKTCCNLKHWGRDKMAPIFQMTFSNAFLELKCIYISIKISPKFVPNGPVNNIPVLAQIIAWHHPGDKPLSQPMIVYWRIYAYLGLSEFICPSPRTSRNLAEHEEQQMQGFFLSETMISSPLSPGWK